MKELLTRKFWQDVKKTFEQAKEDVPPAKSEPPLLPDTPTADPSKTDNPPHGTASSES